MSAEEHPFKGLKATKPSRGFWPNLLTARLSIGSYFQGQVPPAFIRPRGCHERRLPSAPLPLEAQASPSAGPPSASWLLRGLPSGVVPEKALGTGLPGRPAPGVHFLLRVSVREMVGDGALLYFSSLHLCRISKLLW